MPVVKTAGMSVVVGPVDSTNLRRQRILETARRLRGAKSDEEAAEALEAALELAKE